MKKETREDAVVSLMMIIFVLAVFFLLVMAMDCNRFIKKEYSFESKVLKKDAVFILLSDLHGKSFGKNNERLLQAIEAENPDGILIAGDMYTAEKGKDNTKTADFVSALAKKYPVYYGNGNHEHKTRLFPEEFGTVYEDYMSRIKKAGVMTLINQKTSRTDIQADIFGLEIDRSYYKKLKQHKMEPEYLNQKLGRPDKHHFSILIAHNPEFFPAYAKWGADLVVSGHVHGGLMKLPVLGGVISPALQLFPKYDGGVFREENSLMVLGRGLGTHTLPIRIFNPGELIVIRLNKC